MELVAPHLATELMPKRFQNQTKTMF